MSFDWGAYEWVAETLTELAGQHEDSAQHREALARAAIGRAYYSVYHDCQRLHLEIWSKEPPVLGGAGIHKRLLASLKKRVPTLADPQQRTQLEKLSMDLSRLYELRVVADYDAIYPGLSGSATWALDAAKAIRAILVDELGT